MTRREKTIITLVITVTAAVLLVSPFVGMERITPAAVKSGEGMSAEIFWRIRVPRVLIGFIAGASLALSGMAFQAVFRNPLATPFTLGVSSGAAFGAALYMKLGLVFGLAWIPGQSVSAFLWASVSIALVYGLTKVRRGFSTATMLIAGVAINFFFSSLILFMQYMSDFTQSFRIVRWLMGGVETIGYSSILTLIPFTVFGASIIIFNLRELDLLSLGDDIAAGRGVEVRRTRKWIFIAASLLVGGVVSICGPIAFVGMMAPHICRLIVGDGHTRLAPVSFLFGGSFLVLCDTLARTVIAPAEMPVGIITALLGGPFFLWLLLGGASEKSMMYGKDSL
jgi:iron complex transport system permease protein